MSSSAAAAPASSNNAAASSPAPAATPTDNPSSPAETPTDDASSETPSPTDSASAEPTSSPAEEPSSTPAPSSTSASDTPAPTDSSSATPTSSDPSTTSSSVVTSESTNDATTILITSTELPTSTGATNADSSGSQPTTLGSTSKDNSSGLSPGGTIAVAVVVPVVSVAILILVAIWLFRKWKGKKAAEEMRRKEVEEYGFNPNNDPTLPPVGAAYDHPPTQPSDDVSGYRGWGTTSTGRKASTNLSSGAGGMGGLAMSEASSVPGYHNNTPHHQATPSDGTLQFSDGSAAARPMSGATGAGEEENIGVLGAAPAAAHNSTRASDIRRGPSNASSAYSAANRSETSDESNISATHPASPFYDDAPYDPHQSHTVPQQSAYGAYGDGPYAAPSQPVIRDVQARRNTRIESPAVFPRQGNAGIAQNF